MGKLIGSGNTENFGEKLFIDKVQEYLDDTNIIYWNRQVFGREFDVCILMPGKGILVVELKGWREENILRVENNDSVIIRTAGGEASASPQKQARGYRFSIERHIRQNIGKFPLVYQMVCLPQVSKTFFRSRRLDVVMEEKFTILKEDRKTYGSDQYYSCVSAKYHHDSECSCIRLKRSEMEDILVEALRAQINFVKQTRQTAKKENVSPSVQCYRAITQIDKELAQLQNKKMERYEAYRSGEISREEFIKVKDQITTQADELTSKKEQLERDYQAMLQAKQHEAETKAEFSQAEKVLADFDAGLREHLYEAIEQVIVTTNEQIEIKWVFADIFAQKEEIC